MINLLLVFVPVAFVLEYLGAPPLFVFLASSLGIVPLAGWLSTATEELAAHTGAGIGGLLNATFGNATELIIAFFALMAGQVDVVKASIVGSIIGNILLVLGFAAFFGGLRHPKLSYNAEQVKVQASMLVIALIAFVLPAAFDYNEQARFAQTQAQASITDAELSLGVAIVLIALYVASLIFSLITHKDVLSSEQELEMPEASWSVKRSLAVLLGATVAIAFLSEFLVGAIDGFTDVLGLSPTFVGLIIIPIIGNAAEHASAVVFAMKGNMDLAVAVALGSALQIALLVAPLLILLSWVIGSPTDLVLRGPLELTALVGAVLIGNSVARDGETHWLEGLMLLGVYVMLGLAFFFTPVMGG